MGENKDYSQIHRSEAFTTSSYKSIIKIFVGSSQTSVGCQTTCKNTFTFQNIEILKLRKLGFFVVTTLVANCSSCVHISGILEKFRQPSSLHVCYRSCWMQMSACITILQLYDALFSSRQEKQAPINLGHSLPPRDFLLLAALCYHASKVQLTKICPVFYYTLACLTFTQNLPTLVICGWQI